MTQNSDFFPQLCSESISFDFLINSSVVRVIITSLTLTQTAEGFLVPVPDLSMALEVSGSYTQKA